MKFLSLLFRRQFSLSSVIIAALAGLAGARWVDKKTKAEPLA